VCNGKGPVGGGPGRKRGEVGLKKREEGVLSLIKEEVRFLNRPVREKKGDLHPTPREKKKGLRV